MTTQLDPTPEYYESRGMSTELANRLVDDPHVQHPATPLPPDPTDASHIAVKISTHPDNYTPGMRALAAAYEQQKELIAMQFMTEDDMPDIAAGLPMDDGPTPPYIPPAPNPDEFAVKVIATPNAHTNSMVALAKAYESQRERIADLEEDVDRLRPREAFVPEVLFEHDVDGEQVRIETERHGGLKMTVDGCYVATVTLESDIVTKFTTALNKWAGVDGVEWKPVGMFCGPSGLPALLTDGKRVDTGVLQFAGSIDWPYGNKPTHWAPLPKPPVVK